MRSLLIALVLGPVVVAAGKPSTQKDVSLALPQTLRGDPAREHAFFVYPRKMRLVNRRWDTHAHPRDYCANYRVVKRLDNGVFECKCIPPPAHGRQRLAVAVRTATAVGAATLGATAVAVERVGGTAVARVTVAGVGRLAATAVVVKEV